MDISFIYTQKRKEFGKPCTFSDVGPCLITEIESNEELQQEFYEVSKISREIDNSVKVCVHEVNTDAHSSENRGMNHTEGGWPVSVDIADEDSTTRFRKKLDKDKNYANSVKALGDRIETFVMENNSIDIYEEYFSGEHISREKEGLSKTACVLADPYKIARRIVDVSWSLDSSKIAGAYSISGLDMPVLDLNTESYVWDIQNNVSPLCALTPEFALNCISFSPTELNLLLGGYSNGQIGIWDIRIAGHAQQTSDVYESHTEKVSGAKWLETASRRDVFSASTDGKVKWWDTRNLSIPIEIINLDPEETSKLPNIDQKFSVSCVEYDPSVPTKFILGTEQGKILSFDRKSDEILNTIYNTQFGPVLSIERNAFFPQLFSTCDPWVTRIWSEASNESSILNVMSRDGYYSDIAWSPLKPSLLYITNTTGTMEVWNIPGKSVKPIASISLEKKALLSICISDPDSVIACGSISGKIRLLTMPQCFKSTSDDEIELVARCIAGNENVVEGKPRMQRLRHLREMERAEKAELIEKMDSP